MNAFCSGCGKPIANDQILYTADARIVCPQCNGVADVAAANFNAGNKIRNAGISSLVCALVSWVFDPVFIFSILAVSSGIYALTSLGGGNSEQFGVNKDRVAIGAMGVIGLIIVAVKLIVIYLIVSR
jgi:hypothetical protein